MLLWGQNITILILRHLNRTARLRTNLSASLFPQEEKSVGRPFRELEDTVNDQ